MVINYLNIRGVPIITIPDETDSPLIIDPDTMLTVSVPSKRLQSISGCKP